MKSESQRPVLVVDVANLFVRSWIAFPQMSSNGDPMGGFVGFLKTTARIVGETGAKAIYVAWEGGGSMRRRAIFSEYKLGRRPEKLNRFYEDDIPSTDDNAKKQKMLLLQAMKYLPICQLYASDAEGDDVIAYLCENNLRNENKIIVSSDKDFYQLLDDKTSIYNLHKKSIVKKDDVLSEFRISANNFAIAKSICGDKGDNVPGLLKMGFKTLTKFVPMLGFEQDVSLDDVFSFCRSHLNENKAYQRLLDFEKDARRNWRLVYLNGNMIARNQADRIDKVVETFAPAVNKMAFMELLIREGLINVFDVNTFLLNLNGIERKK